MMREIIDNICHLLYADEPKAGVDLFVENATSLAGFPGFADWINPLFDAADRGDYIYMADVLRFEICAKET